MSLFVEISSYQPLMNLSLDINLKNEGNWVNKSRQMYRKHLEGKKNSMTQERIQILNKMGFIWLGTSDKDTTETIGGSEIPISYRRSRDIIWNDNSKGLQQYIEANGSSISLSGSTKLGVWAAKQRREYQKLKLGEKAGITQERVDLLDSIGFDWSPWETKWQLRVNELLEYKREHGDCLVSYERRQ